MTNSNNSANGVEQISLDRALVERILQAHEMSCVDWPAMRRLQVALRAPATAPQGSMQALLALIANDAHAMSFQSMAQYRNALLNSVAANCAPAPAGGMTDKLRRIAQKLEADGDEHGCAADIRDLLSRSNAPQPEAAQPAPMPVALLDELREKIRDAVANSLNSTYVCGRVWSAWQAGTMSEDDFIPFADCDEEIDAVVDAVIAALPLQSQPVQIDPFEAVYCAIFGGLPNGLAACDNFKDWKCSLMARCYNQSAPSTAVPEGLIELLRSIRPKYGDVGTRDIDVTEKQSRIDAAIAMLTAAPSGDAKDAAWWAVTMEAAASLEDAVSCLADQDAQRTAKNSAEYVRKRARELAAMQQPNATTDGDK